MQNHKSYLLNIVAVAKHKKSSSHAIPQAH